MLAGFVEPQLLQLQRGYLHVGGMRGHRRSAYSRNRPEHVQTALGLDRNHDFFRLLIGAFSRWAQTLRTICSIRCGLIGSPPRVILALSMPRTSWQTCIS